VLLEQGLDAALEVTLRLERGERARARAKRLGPFAREDLVLLVVVAAHLDSGLGFR
jgi:hypothetical protein